MSESYLTHIKNGTRRWNEDALKKLSSAFNINPVDLFSQRRSRTDDIEMKVEMPKETGANLKLKIVPVMGDIPSAPSAYNNQIMQVTTGYKDVFVPVFNSADESMFSLCLENNSFSPFFSKGDYLIISPEVWAKSGDIAAVEYGSDNPVKSIMKVTYVDDFILLESVNHKHNPIALVRGKDHFRIIGKIVFRYQKLG